MCFTAKYHFCFSFLVWIQNPIKRRKNSLWFWQNFLLLKPDQLPIFMQGKFFFLSECFEIRFSPWPKRSGTQHYSWPLATCLPFLGKVLWKKGKHSTHLCLTHFLHFSAEKKRNRKFAKPRCLGRLKIKNPLFKPLRSKNKMHHRAFDSILKESSLMGENLPVALWDKWCFRSYIYIS